MFDYNIDIYAKSNKIDVLLVISNTPILKL